MPLRQVRLAPPAMRSVWAIGFGTNSLRLPSWSPGRAANKHGLSRTSSVPSMHTSSPVGASTSPSTCCRTSVGLGKVGCGAACADFCCYWSREAALIALLFEIGTAHGNSSTADTRKFPPGLLECLRCSQLQASTCNGIAA